MKKREFFTQPQFQRSGCKGEIEVDQVTVWDVKGKRELEIRAEAAYQGVSTNHYKLLKPAMVGPQLGRGVSDRRASRATRGGVNVLT